jgi:glycosyltransferase involved in cell wall biosynthesis
MDQPLVTIITATFNARAFLPGLLHKVRASTYHHVQHIIIDDCSTDGTPEILKTLQGAFGFALIESPANQGPVRARNQAIANSRGKYLLPWDQDNWFSPDYIATTVAAAERAGEHCSPIYSHMTLTGERNREVPRPEWSRELVFRERFVDLGCLFSRKAYEAAGGIDPASFPLSDYELFFGMAVHGFQGKLVDGPRFYYGVRKESAWDRFRTPEGHAKKREVSRYIFDKHRARLAGLGEDADALRDAFIQKYYSGSNFSLSAQASLQRMAEETLKMIPDAARVIGFDSRDEFLRLARKDSPGVRWMDFGEMESSNATVDCLVISQRMNDPRVPVRKHATHLRPGGTLIGRIANAHHWHALAEAFAGKSATGYGSSPGALRAQLEKAGFSEIETRAVNVDGDDSAEESNRFLAASAPLIEALGIEPAEFARRCDVTHYLLRAVRAESAAPAPPAK